MQNTFRRIIAPPNFPEDENKSRVAYYMHFMMLFSLSALVALQVFRLLQGNTLFEPLNLVLSSLTVVLAIVWALVHSGTVRPAAYIYISVIWLASTLLSFYGNGIRGLPFASYFIVMLLAGTLLGKRAAVSIAVLSAMSSFGMAYAETTGMITYTPSPALAIAGVYAVIFFSALFIYLTITDLQNALKAAQANSVELETSNRELKSLRDDLEIRLHGRTTSLEKRAAQIQAVSSMARTIASVQDLNALLPNITSLVSKEFGVYHTGIFLGDDAGKYAVLKASNSEGGKRMLKREHRLLLDSNSIVGHVMSRGEPRIARDVEGDSVFFNNPDLPETRSEMAFPLRVSGRVIGALDIQSTQTDAFSQEDISLLSTLADQIAIAIENARLFGQAQRALSDAQATYEKYAQQSWNSFVQQARHTGFIFDGKQVMPFDSQSKRDYVKPAIQTGSLSLEKSSETIAVSIKLRGQTIGFLDIHSKKGKRMWTRDEIALLEAAAERAALALENARLVESAQRRAARERAIGDISSKIGAVSSFEYILQTAVEELGRKIGGATEVTLEIGSDNNEFHQQ